jgi:hypothetical protein
MATSFLPARARSLGFAVIALAGLACKSKVATPAGSALPPCGGDQLLVGPSSSWTCTSASTLSVASAKTAISAGSATFAANATSVIDAGTADQAGALGLGPFAIGAPVPDADAGVTFAVAGGPVLAFSRLPIPFVVAGTAQLDAGIATQGGVQALFTVPLTLDATRKIHVRAVGVLTGTGTVSVPNVCTVTIGIGDPNGTPPTFQGSVIAPVGNAAVPVFQGPDAGASPPVPGYSPWYVEGWTTLDAGTYTVFGYVTDPDSTGATFCEQPVPPTTVPASISVEAI